MSAGQRERRAGPPRDPFTGPPTRRLELEPEAPTDEGIVLATLGRSATGNSETRVSWRHWRGRAFVDVRVWFRSRDSGAWRPTAKGATLRPVDLLEAEHAIKRARELSAEETDAASEPTGTAADPGDSDSQ